MRNLHTIATAILLLTAAAEALGQTTFTGKIEGTEGICNKLVVNAIKGNRPMPIDTIEIGKGGQYQITVGSERPTLYIVTLDSPAKPMMYLMAMPKEKVSMNLRYEAAINYLEVESVKGSKDMDMYRQFSQEIGRCQRKAYVYNQEYSLPSTSENRKQELQDSSTMLMDEQDDHIEQIILKHKDVLMSAFLATYFQKKEAEHIGMFTELRDALSKKYADEPLVKNLEAIVKRNIGPGMMAPEIEMKNPEGEVLKLSDLKGKVVLIDFWASWCAPCRAEMPNVVRMYKKYKDAGLEIYSVSLDNKKESWTNAINSMGMTWSHHVSDLQGWTSTGGAAYGVTSIPSTFLIDKDGKIIAKNLRGNDLGDKLKEIFGF